MTKYIERKYCQNVSNTINQVLETNRDDILTENAGNREKIDL